MPTALAPLPVPPSIAESWPRPPLLSGEIACGGGGKTGFSNAPICEDENEYVCASLRICAAASCRSLSFVDNSAAAASLSAAEAPESLPTALAASRPAWSPGSVRGIDA
ncbi:hypothetical protein OHA79_19660 [Streptomyces sp. NBC_00841]|uniref:hypothetical protein n=1 Tax=Streptomyces sp. NBC_00841 TaxID=2975847 RepID=UPI002DDB6B7C|nr:hypothetical protein [Streptomyces sp. NBC_00841]WRZ99868.1 hypothetical protein OHA79_19660 [Streptomyces sp. NBC_00841]